MTVEFGSSLTTGTVNRSGTGGYFKPEPFLNAYAILVEPKVFVDAPNSYYDPEDPRSKPTRGELTANLTVWGRPEDLDAGSVTATLVDVILTQPYLVADLKGSIGKAEVISLLQKPNKKPGWKPSWVIKDVSPHALPKIIAHIESRDAVEADGDDDLDFLK